MGNNTNIGTRVGELCLYVQTNEPYYSPNSMVTGSVYLDLYRPLRIYSVELKLRGTERIKWEELKDNPSGNGNKITEKMKDKLEIFRTVVQLQSMSGDLPMGQYQYPFAFQLPDQIPGTFDIKHFDYDGRVRYTLTAVLSCSGRDPVKHRTELVVRQRPAMANYNTPVRSDENVCICCSNKGRCSMTCHFQSDTYQPGNDAVLMTEVDNTICTVDIKNFVVSLIQHVTFKARNGKSSDFTRTVRSSDFPGIARHSSNRGNPQLMSLRLEESGSEAGKLIQPNVRGIMITCNYELEIRPIFDAPCSCCSNTPVVKVPLYIYAPELRNWISAIPQGFCPKLYNVQNIIIPMPSMKIEFNTGLGNISAGLPMVSAQVVEHSAPRIPSVTANISGPSTSINMGVPGATMNMEVSSNVGVGGAKVRMGMPSANISMGVPSANVTMDVSGGMEIEGPGMRMDVVGGNMVGGNVSMGIEGPGVRMEVTGDPMYGNVNAGNVHVSTGFGGGNFGMGVTSETRFGTGASVGVGVPGANVEVRGTGADAKIDFKMGF